MTLMKYYNGGYRVQPVPVILDNSIFNVNNILDKC
jgi:hypothetical protein